MRSYSGHLNVVRPLPSRITSRRVEWLRWSRDLTVMSSIPVWTRHSSLFVFITMYRHNGTLFNSSEQNKISRGCFTSIDNNKHD